MADLKLLKLVIDGNSYSVPDASATEKGLMSADHFSKLEGIESGAQVNKIEEIQVNSVKVDIAQKIVNILVTEGSANGNISVAGKDVAVKGLAALAYKASVTETELDEAVKTKLAQIETNKQAIATLNGTSEGSVKKTVDDAIKAWAELVTADNETVDTFKELVDWVAKHGTEAGELTEAINAIEAILEGIGGESEPATVTAYVAAEIAKLDIDNKIANAVKNAGVTYSYEATSGALTLTGISAAAAE